MKKILHAETALLPDGFRRNVDIVVDGEIIDSIVSSGGARSANCPVINAAEALVVPGIVDFHGDAFERSLAPRSGTRLPAPIAFRDVDAQLVANGITTGCYSPTLTWQTHRSLRNDDGAREVVESFAEIRPFLRADSLLHLRYEIHHLSGESQVRTWLEQGMVDLLAFNDHLSWMRERLANPRARAALAHSFEKADHEMDAVADAIEERKPQAFEAVERLATVAREVGVPMCSHDEEAPEQRRWYHERGCRVAEFPVNEPTAGTARELGDEVVLGAPNVLKGQSLYGRLSARKAVENALCSILASDYYYPSLLHAPFLIEKLGLAALDDAWKLVSLNAARALGLRDRGALEPGMRADITVITFAPDGTPVVAATLVAGSLAYLGDERILSLSGNENPVGRWYQVLGP